MSKVRHLIRKQLQLERLNKLLKVIERNIDKFDMRYYSAVAADPECGTVSCIAGFAIEILTKFRFVDSQTIATTLNDPLKSVLTVKFRINEVGKLLAFTPEFADAIFHMNRFNNDFIDWDTNFQIIHGCTLTRKEVKDLNSEGIERLKMAIQLIEEDKTEDICDYDRMITGCLVEYRLKEALAQL
jgi:hypothetical protein